MIERSFPYQALTPGTDWAFCLRAEGSTLFPADAAWSATVKDASDTVLATLTSPADGLKRVDDATLQFKILGTASEAWTGTSLQIDLTRTDTDPDEDTGISVIVPMNPS